jgi:hypothetical protein
VYIKPVAEARRGRGGQQRRKPTFVIVVRPPSDNLPWSCGPHTWIGPKAHIDMYICLISRLFITQQGYRRMLVRC